MTANRYERCELFRRFHLQNHQNVDEINSPGDNLSVKSDNQANQRNQSFTCHNYIEAKSSCLWACLVNARFHFEPHPASLGTGIHLPRVKVRYQGEVPHLPWVPRFHVDMSLDVNGSWSVVES